MPNGPRITVELSCRACTYVRSDRYQVQGDSGSHVYCMHPVAAESNDGKRIGDTTWSTPMWCPYLAGKDGVK